MGGVVSASFLVSFAVSKISLFDRMSDSMKISLLTVIIAAIAAYLFPAKDEDEDHISAESRKDDEGCISADSQKKNEDHIFSESQKEVTGHDA